MIKKKYYNNILKLVQFFQDNLLIEEKKKIKMH